MDQVQRTLALGAVRRATDCYAAVVRIEMKRGLTSLATIASIAPFVGMFGTLVRIVCSFPGSSMDKHTLLGVIAKGLAESLKPTELGLVVAGFALLSYKYLLAQVLDFDAEMKSASLQLMNELSLVR